MLEHSCCGQFFSLVHVYFHFVVGDYVVVDVGTSMEGNFLGGTKNTKKVVHFECGSTQGKWFGGNNGGGGGGVGGGTVAGDGGRAAVVEWRRRCKSHQPCCCWFDMHDSKGSKTNLQTRKKKPSREREA